MFGCQCEFHKGQMADLNQMISTVHPSLEGLAKQLWVSQSTAAELRKQKIVDLAKFVFSLLPKATDDKCISLERFAEIQKSLISDPFFFDTLDCARASLNIKPLASTNCKTTHASLFLYALEEKKGGKTSHFFDRNRAVQEQVKRFLLDRPDDMRLLPPNCSPELVKNLDLLFGCESEEARVKIINRDNILAFLEYAEFSKFRDITHLCLKWMQEKMDLSADLKDGKLNVRNPSRLSVDTISFLNSLKINTINIALNYTRQNNFPSLLTSICQISKLNIELSLNGLRIGELETGLLLELLKSNTTSLSFDNCTIDQSNMIKISQGIRNSQSIHSFEFRLRKLTLFEEMSLSRNSRMRAIRPDDTTAVKEPPQLDDSWEEKFTPEASLASLPLANAFADMIGECKSLTHLVVCDQRINEEGAKEIATALTKNKSIRSLALEFHSSVKSEALIFSIVEKCRRIDELELTDKNLGDSAAKELVKLIVEEIPSIRSIKISTDSFHRQSIASYPHSKE